MAQIVQESLLNLASPVQLDLWVCSNAINLSIAMGLDQTLHNTDFLLNPLDRDSLVEPKFRKVASGTLESHRIPISSTDQHRV